MRASNLNAFRGGRWPSSNFGEKIIGKRGWFVTQKINYPYGTNAGRTRYAFGKAIVSNQKIFSIRQENQKADLPIAPEANRRWSGLAGSHQTRYAWPRRGGGPCQGIRSCKVVK